VIVNKVQGPDGQWRSLDGRVLHKAAVAVSELYDNVIADRLAAALPLRGRIGIGAETAPPRTS
jgi:TrwC relaxase